MKKKPIHLIVIRFDGLNRAVCNKYGINCHPIEDKLNYYKNRHYHNLGTFDVTKVTCKKCLKSKIYKDYIKKLDAEEMPLFYGDYRND